MACTRPDYQKDGICLNDQAAVNLQKDEIYWAFHSDWLAAATAAVPTIVYGATDATGNHITTFTPTALLHKFAVAPNFDPAIGTPNVRANSGQNMFAPTITMQVIGNTKEIDSQVSLLKDETIVIVVRLKGVESAALADQFKVIGCQSGLRVPDGGIVRGLDGGMVAQLTFAADADKQEFDAYERYTIADTDLATTITNIAAAVVV